MELHQVRYFLAVAEELNFSRAAEKCNVSQPALSRGIILLEGEFGGLLFNRRSVPGSDLAHGIEQLLVGPARADHQDRAGPGSAPDDHVGSTTRRV